MRGSGTLFTINGSPSAIFSVQLDWDAVVQQNTILRDNATLDYTMLSPGNIAPFSPAGNE